MSLNISRSSEKLLEDFCKVLHQEIKLAVTKEKGVTINLRETKIVKPATSYRQYSIAFSVGLDEGGIRFYQGKLYYKRRNFIQKLFGNKDEYEYILVQQILLEHNKSPRGYALGTKIWEEKISATIPVDPYPYEQKLSRFTDQVPSVVNNVLKNVQAYRGYFLSVQERDKNSIF
ncbi:MAG TPA: hypothetical protein HA294_00855 [Nanoarchaeota archaeon]|nr:hypothetical protein [Candidatus Woesearchaeota archaeon]HIH15031.1 hypothetical protein [Nanoarchaeota archaeon]HIH58534.1 hypothetical protein [Nanoarchaeota archaeon]HIJ05524.1 hypothetical protein [Nanoarchaeota archaeon]